MSRARKKPELTEAIVAEVLASDAFTQEEREAVQLMRKQLTDAGITTEPMRTRMACEFAGVLIGRRKKLP